MTLSTIFGTLFRPLRNMFISSWLPMVYLAFWASILKLLMYWLILEKQKTRWLSDAWVTFCLVELVNCPSNQARKLR